MSAHTQLGVVDMDYVKMVAMMRVLVEDPASKRSIVSARSDDTVKALKKLAVKADEHLDYAHAYMHAYAHRPYACRSTCPCTF